MALDTAQVLAVVRAHPGMTRAAAASTLGGARAHTLAAIAAALAGDVVHEAVTYVPSRGGAQRSARGLYPGPAAADVAPAAASSGEMLREARTATGVGAPAVAAVLGVSTSLVYAWEAGRQPVPGWATPRLAGALEAAQQRSGLTRRRDTRELHQLLEQVRRSPGITRKALGVGDGRRGRLLQDALRTGRLHVAPAWVGPNRREVAGLYPGARPRPVAAAAPVSGADVAAARRAAGWSQRPMAKALGVSKGTLCRWERAGAPLPVWAANAANAVLADVEDRPAQQDARLLEQVRLRPGIAREGLTRGTFGRSAAVLESLERLLATGQLHLAAVPTRNATGAWRHTLGLFLGPAPAAAEPLPGAELEQRRRAAGLSRAELARRLEVSDTQVWHWELGHQPIPDTRAEQARVVIKQAGLAPVPYTDQVNRSDEELEDLALAAITARPGRPARQVTAEMHGSMQRRIAAVSRLLAADVVHIRPVPHRQRDGRTFTRDGLEPGPASTEPIPWAATH